MSAVINISYAHSTICCCFYCIHISFFIITLQRYVLFPIPPNFSPFFSSTINNQKLAPPRPRRTNTRTSCVKQSQLCCVKQSQFYCVKQSQFYCVKYSRATPCGRELVCEYRPSRPGFKSSLLRMGGFRREVEPLLAGEDG